MALFNLGFRIFFLAAGLFSIVAISLWMLLYFNQFSLALEPVLITHWHAHEMIYGYSMAVIAGFLLTAVKNWTGMQTLNGKPLMVLFGLWLAARLLFTLDGSLLLAAAAFDLAFSVFLIIAVTYPVVKTKQWLQLAVVAKLMLLAAFNLLFYLGVFEILDLGEFWGIYGGLYLVVGLILTMGRRVIPFFIERGIDRSVSLFNSRWLDLSSLCLFVGFFICELFVRNALLSSILMAGLFVVNAIRLVGWHVPEIWQRSLLWSIYLAFWFICFGFLLFAMSYYLGILKFLAIHAFAFGGIGVMTLSMMSRVALGHTGRKVNSPPRVIGLVLAVLAVGAVCRVVVPIFDANHYLFWIGVSALLWIVAFVMFTMTFFPVLTKPRIDGRSG